MRSIGLYLSLGLVVLATGLQGQSYYVNGLTGKDIPTNGGSAATPWKTIGYSLAQIPRPISTNPVLWIEGNQVYSSATNGEVFPIRPAFEVWIEATLPGFQKPVLKPPAGVTAFLYDPSESYLKNNVTVRYLAFDGGNYAVRLGAGSLKKHAPRFQDCEFRNQSVAAVRIDAAVGNSTNDPRFFQCTFGPLPAGFEMHASSANSVLYPDIDECTFAGVTSAAVFLDDAAPASTTVGGSVHSCWFRGCGTGVHVRTSAGSYTPDFNVYSSSFVDIQNEGVYFELLSANGLGATVKRSSFLRCAIGVRLEGVAASGNHALALDKDSMQGCAAYGVKVDLGGAATVKVSTQSGLYDGCGTGLGVNVRAGSLQYEQTSLGDRALRCGTGFAVQGLTTGKGVALLSCLACASTARGVDVTGSVPTTVRCCTLADNATGLGANGSAMTLDHLVFGGNTANVTSAGSPAITYSCFQGSTLVGTGNLNQTDPQLVRPFYKLAVTSPCLDKGNPALALPATDYEGDARASISQLGGQALPDLGADEYVLAGSARKYGTPGYGQYFFFPEISAGSSEAFIGGTLEVKLTNALLPIFATPAVAAALTFGTRDDSGPFPFELGALGAPGNLLWNELLATLGPFAVTSTGTSTASIQVPLAQVLIGQTFTMQWFAFLPVVNAYGVATSDGLRVTVGQALKSLGEEFDNANQLDKDNSTGSWSGGFASPGAIGGSGVDGEFSLQTTGIESIGGNTYLFRTTPETVGTVTKFVEVPATSSYLNKAHQVVDGRLEYSSFVLPAGTTLVFRGNLPPRISVRGKLDIQGRIVLNGESITSSWSPPTPVVGRAGASGGCFGGNGGKGANAGNGLGHQVAFDGQPGENVKLLSGHAYANRAPGTGGLGSVQFPLNGLASSITKQGIGGAICDQICAGGGGGGYDLPGAFGKAYYTLSSIAANVGPDSVGGASFSNFPIPGGALAQDHFLVGGSGGGGAGSCPYFNTSAPPTYNAGDAGAGGGGAIAFRAGSDLLLGSGASIEAKGGSGFQTVVLNNLPGGGGGSGGSILLQVAGNVGQSGLLTVAGGAGASLQYTAYPVKVQGGNGSPGYIRLETTQAPSVALLGTCVPAAATRNVAALTETDAKVGSQSLWYKTGLATAPKFVRYTVKAKVNSIDTYYSDDPTLNLPLAKEGEAVELYVQGANLAANGQPIPGQISEWMRYAGKFPTNTGRSLDEAGYTSFRFQLVLHRIGNGTVFVDNVTVLYR